ncbi:hypothetical protein LPJ56_001650 [Coemansia sp. RSA 2599]|nr:hypothetical protein LPJ56_001650 [Coemansia sp. RSA 2599]
MTAHMQHEYTELADMTSSAVDNASATERVYEATDGLPGAQRVSSQQRRGIRALLNDREFRKHVALSLLYMLMWYTFSSMLSVYNKWLFGNSERDFSFPLFVSSVHMMVQYCLAALCLRLFPRLRPSQTPTMGTYLTRAVPCGLASAMDIGLSNISLRTITLTFYTMCKSSALGFVLVFAFLFGLERVRLVLVAIIAVISVGVVLMAAGEVDFVWAGFIEAIASSAMSGLRWSLTQILLSQARFGMNNPVATMSKLMPVIGSSLFVFSLILEHPFSEIPKNKNMQTTESIVLIASLMVLGGVLAFAMVLSEFLLISRTSVVTLSIGGMLRDVLMVAMAHFIFGDTMTFVNVCGLMVALFGIGLYNWLKIHDALYSKKQADFDNEGGDEVYQRQLVFAVDPYDEMAATDLGLQTSQRAEWDPDTEGGTLRSKHAISSGVDENIGAARRRLSVKNIDTSLAALKGNVGRNEASGNNSGSSSSSSVPSAIDELGLDTNPNSHLHPRLLSPENSPTLALDTRPLKRSESAESESFVAERSSPGPTRLKHRD